MVKRLEVDIGTLVLTVTPALGGQARADYLPDSREVVYFWKTGPPMPRAPKKDDDPAKDKGM